MTPPSDKEREQGRRTEMDQIRQMIELIKRESAEQTQAIASLKNGFELLQVGKRYEQKEITDIVARLTQDVQTINAWRHASYRDMWEGDKSFSSRIKDIERELQDLSESIKELRAELPRMVEEAIAKRDGAFNGRVRIEHTKGFWALLVAIAVAVVSALGLLVKEFIAGTH